MTRPSSLAIWDYFIKLPGNDKIAKCIQCSKSFSYRTSVTNLRTHLKIVHPLHYTSFLEDTDPSSPRPRAISKLLKVRENLKVHQQEQDVIQKSEQQTDTDNDDNDSIIAFEIEAVDGDETQPNDVSNLEETKENDHQNSRDKPSLFSDYKMFQPLAHTPSKEELTLRLKLMKRAFLEQERRARECHDLEMRILKEKLRQARSMADLAERRLS